MSGGIEKVWVPHPESVFAPGYALKEHDAKVMLYKCDNGDTVQVPKADMDKLG